MEGINWTTVIATIISFLTTGGGLVGIFFYRENKRAKQLQNETSASEQWRELYLDAKEEIKTLNNKIDGMYKTIGCMRDQINSLLTQKAVLTMFKCETLNCPTRKPPFGSTTIKEQKNELKQLCQDQED